MKRALLGCPASDSVLKIHFFNEQAAEKHFPFSFSSIKNMKIWYWTQNYSSWRWGEWSSTTFSSKICRQKCCLKYETEEFWKKSLIEDMRSCTGGSEELNWRWGCLIGKILWRYARFQLLQVDCLLFLQMIAFYHDKYSFQLQRILEPGCRICHFLLKYT